MATALLDVPRCLNVEASFVGPPSAFLAISWEQRSAWADAQPCGGTGGFRQQAVNECLDTAAILRDYREPLEGENWLTPAVSERRLLAQVNAIIALGPDALNRVCGLSLDPDVPDPGRVFAALFVLGCAEGGHWLVSARDIFAAAAMRNPAEAAAAVEALSLCPHSEVAAVVAPLLDHDEPRIRSCTIRTLAFRGALTEDAWNDAMRDRNPAVVVAALCAPLSGYDRVVCKRALQPMFARRDTEGLVRHALRAGLSLRLGPAHDCAVQIVSSNTPTWADALSCLSMFGNLADARYIHEVLNGPRPEDGLQAASILGSIELVRDLLALLDRKDLLPEIGARTRQALSAITGLPFADAKAAEHAHRLWTHHASRFELDVRYRNGRPMSLEAMLQSLLAGPGSREIRQQIYLEMQAATASRVPRFSAYDFVGVQSESLRRIKHWLSGSNVRHAAATNLHKL